MKRLAVFFVLGAAAACGSTSSSSSNDDYPFPSGAGGKSDSVDTSDLPVAMDDPMLGYFEQEIDHSTDASLGTFWQRYWVSTQFADGADSPVLLYFCGEGPCDPWYATTMADAAMALHASVVVLEHRYYGESLPYSDFSLAHMKYLTIHNALEDAAAFERFARASVPGLSGKWIAVGGSYAGMLAAFYRETHPELVVGAWASSAPIDVHLSFWGYDATVTAALGESCASRFRIALGAAEDAFDDDGRRDVVAQQLFGQPAPANLADFLQWVSSIAEGAAQYGNQAGLCASLAAHPDAPLTGVIAYVNPGAAGARPLGHPLPAGKVMPVLTAPTADNFQGAAWFYQVCTEVGFYQTANIDQGQSILSWLINEQYWADQCTTYVGTAPAIDATRAAYVNPIYDSQVSNLFMVNGTLDPWSTLSITYQGIAPDGVTVAGITNGSHCSDLENLTPDSPADVFAAHKAFHDLALTWLK